LAKAVTDAGGLGLIGLGYGDQEWLDREFLAAGNARTGCGFITWSLARQPHLLNRALDHKPAAVMLSFGDPKPFAMAIKRADAALNCQVQTVADAMEAVDIGADIVVAQGTEAVVTARCGRPSPFCLRLSTPSGNATMTLSWWQPVESQTDAALPLR
jgi:nitronate monooxygenase